MLVINQKYWLTADYALLVLKSVSHKTFHDKPYENEILFNIMQFPNSYTFNIDKRLFVML